MILIARTSRYREYLQENLRLLAGARGETFVVRVRRERVESGLLERSLAQEPVLLLLSEAPHERPAAVRLARVAEARLEDDRLTLRLLLGGYPIPEASTAALGARLAGAAPGALLELPEGNLVVEAEGVDEERAWRAAVDRLLDGEAAPFFKDSVFMRPVGLWEVEGGAEAEPLALRTDGLYELALDCHNPHLAPEARAACRLGAGHDPAELELLPLPRPSPWGQVRVRVRPLVPGSARLQLFVRPGAEVSTRLALELHATGAQAVRPAACGEVAGEALRRGVRAVWGVLARRDALRAPGLEREVLETMLGLLPEDGELRRALALCHHRAGAHAEAWRLFDELGAQHLLPEDRLPHLLSACAVGAPPEALLELAGRLPWDQVDADAARRLGAAVAGLPERALLPLLESLAYFGTERFLADIWREARDAIRSPGALLKTSALLHETGLLTPAEIARYLVERVQVLELRDPGVDARLVELGLEAPQAPPGFGEALARELARLAAEGEPGEARARLEAARARLTPAAHEQARLGLAEALLGAGGEEAAGVAAALLVAAGESARRRGDLEATAELLERAAAADPGEPGLPAAQAALERAVGAQEPLLLLGEALQGQRLARLRERLAGQRLVVVGGPQARPWVEELRRELALAEVTWFPSRLGEPPRPEAVREALSGAAGLVAVLTFYVGHHVAEAVRDEARRRALPCAFVTAGTSKAA
ncbi:MAG TPA: hypothetical protein P5076_20635, partial [Myxococcota bacterium]|nr:hypothetical protein [Myxococcota bacterium]